MRFQVVLGVSILIGVVIGMILLLVLSSKRSAGRPPATPLLPGHGLSQCVSKADCGSSGSEVAGLRITAR
jgi:hypothetical protein